MTFFESLFESSFQYYMCSVTRQLNKHQITGCLNRLLTNFKLKYDILIFLIGSGK